MKLKKNSKMKIVTGIATLLIAMSCTSNDAFDQIPDQAKNDVVNSETNIFRVSEEEAKERLAFVMNQLEPVPTYGSSRRVAKDVHAWRLDKQGAGTYSSTGGSFMGIDTLLYIINFNDDNGFALVSADNRTTPVLAIINDGFMTADDIENVDNPGFIAFMNNAIGMLLNEIATNDEPIATYATAAVDQSNMIQVRSNTTRSYPARLKTKWGQMHPYNMLTPMLSNTRTPTGCVATAGAQALSFFQTINSVSWTDSRHNASGSSALNWNAIISDSEQWDWAVKNERWRHVPEYYRDNTYGYGRLGTGRTTTTQVAHLMRYLGCKINATYSPSSTEASTDQLLVFLKFSCGLSGSFSMMEKYTPRNVFDAFDSSNALVLIRANNKNESVGHSWLIDGGQEIIYSGNDKKQYVHCNFGWDSYSDGYYLSGVFACTNGPVFADNRIELGGGTADGVIYTENIAYAILKK